MPGADHSVPGSVSAENYDYFISLIKDYGRYPLNLVTKAGILGFSNPG